MSVWGNPELWNGIGVVGLVILFAIALAREWLVTGPSHRREIASRDRTIAMLEARGDKDAESIGTFANTQRDMNAEKASETRLIAAVRDALLSNQGQQT